VNKLDLLFDAKQFAAVFEKAIGESSSELRKCRPDITAHSEGDAASIGAEFSPDGDQQVVRDLQPRRKEK